MALKDIKAKILATKRMHTVTRAMEAVSAVKMRKTQSDAFEGRPYARAALAILARLSGTRALLTHPLGSVRPVSRVALVVITSDKGLAGSLNSSVLKAALEAVASYKKENVTVYAVGRKGEEFFRNRGYVLGASFENKEDAISIAAPSDLAAFLTSGFLAHSYDQVLAAYSNFKSTFEQEATVRPLLPLQLDAIRTLVEDIQPVRGKGSQAVSLEIPAEYSVEPSEEEVLSVLIPRLVAVSLYHMLLEGKASEHSARMVAMKNASDKSKEVTRDFTRLYNKVRQAAITREVSEIVSGREALAS